MTSDFGEWLGTVGVLVMIVLALTCLSVALAMVAKSVATASNMLTPLMIIDVLVSSCVWRALPPCFGGSKSTTHRRFLIWSRAGVWGRPHEEILHRLDDVGPIDVSRAVLDPARVRAEQGGANSQVRAPWTGASRSKDSSQK